MFITAISQGFFVNRSTRSHFDPSPASAPHFSHELLHCLLEAVPSLGSAWSTLIHGLHRPAAANSASGSGSGSVELAPPLIPSAH